MSRVLTILVAVVLVGGVATTAWAGPKLFITDTEGSVIVGEYQTPEISETISRKNLNESYNLELRESFLPKIVKSVEQDPF